MGAVCFDGDTPNDGSFENRLGRKCYAIRRIGFPTRPHVSGCTILGSKKKARNHREIERGVGVGTLSSDVHDVAEGPAVAHCAPVAWHLNGRR